ncbi:hypothetical protein B0H14DRAFT_3481074 [Mycena olivaceomarginata]|nr:hypothetical protein B0H14DRAFT_3481074 [Mycena olivaceomarginata]
MTPIATVTILALSTGASLPSWALPPAHERVPPLRGMGTFISTLHTILKPVLLRKIKADVLGAPLFPPNKCYILCARLGARQWEASEAILARLKRKSMGKEKVTAAERDAEEQDAVRVCVPLTVLLGLLATLTPAPAKHVDNMKLRNTVMQLRGTYSHPFLFAQPDDAKRSLGAHVLACFFLLVSVFRTFSTIPSPRIRTPMPTASYQRAKSPHLSARAPPTSEVLAAYEAEMLLLDWLLGELFKLGHKNPPLSRFTTRLDIIEAVDMKGWSICRIDETTPPRPDEHPPELPSVPRLLCLRCSARAAAASALMDTVIFYDQDWVTPGPGPRARDWAGEAKPVLIFRPIGTHAVEEKQATEKLEALAPANSRLEVEQVDVLPTTTQAGDENIFSDADFEALLRLCRSSQRRMRVAEVMSEEVEE